MLTIIIYLLIAALLLLLNGLFVLAEFAAVKARPTQMEALSSKGNRKARKMLHIQTHLDQYLSVCQIGITLASIGLGFVGEPAIAGLVRIGFDFFHISDISEAVIHTVAVVIAYILVSFLHIVIGELVPKSIAIRKTEKSALLMAYPLTFFYYLFILPLLFLNTTANIILKCIRIPPVMGHTEHSEEEIRLILDKSQNGGMMSFRRLLYVENVLDMGSLFVSNIMLPANRVITLNPSMSKAEIDCIIHKYKYSRYLLVDHPDEPIGYVHIKDIYLNVIENASTLNLRKIARPCLKFPEQTHLELVVQDMQRKANHIALVFDENQKWKGMVTLEDLLEEIVGTIEEEFPIDVPVRLTKALSSAEQIVFDTKGDNIISATKDTLSKVNSATLPLPLDEIMSHIIERERLGTSYVGHQIAIPHARIRNIVSPIVIIAKLKEPIPAPTSSSEEFIRFLFIILSPLNIPRQHQIILSHIARLFESDYFECRMVQAKTPQELFTIICDVEQTTDMTQTEEVTVKV
jgi:CBS domain containing-hemolysin-like protein/mannitol/fructose-specific phosphotransferase system IIA component (Ntr-type)